MAAFAFLMGSVLGFIAGLAGWLFFDLSLLSALAVYLGGGVMFSLTVVAANAVNCTEKDSLSLQVANS